MDINRKTKYFSLSFFAVVSALVWSTIFSKEQSSDLTVNFLDVGQGDAIFIETPNHNQALIDGGSGSAVLAQLGKVMPYYDKEIDLLVLTHPDADHLGGLIEVLKRYEVGKILTTGVKTDTNGFQAWQDLIKNKNIPVQIAEFGQVVNLSSDVNLYILSPFENLEGKNVKDLNNTSIVSRLVYGELEILLTGDAEKKLEGELMAKKVNLKSDILKVGHHGSKSSTGENFLEEIKPKKAVIQVGENNRYKHPSKEILDGLDLKGVKIYRTDENGDIEVKSDGKSYEIKIGK